MRVLHWIDGFAPTIGGAEVMALALAQAQLAAGHEVAVLTESLPGRPDEETFQGVGVRRMVFARRLLSQNAAEVAGAVQAAAAFRRQFAPDVVHLHLLGAAAWFELQTRSAGRGRVVVTVHPPVGQVCLPRGMVARVLRQADRVVAVSESQRRDIQGLVPELGSRLICQYNGLAQPARPTGEPSWDPPTLLCLGRLTEVKGFDVALEAYAGLAGWRARGAQLVVAGEGPHRSELERRAAELGLGPNEVRFSGWVAPDDIPALIDQACAVLMPSRWAEPFGLVALQAAQRERPVLASRVGGLPEVVEHGVTGWLLPPGDVMAWTRALEECLGGPERSRTLGRAAARRVTERFSLAACAAGYDSLYQLAQDGAPLRGAQTPIACV